MADTDEWFRDYPEATGVEGLVAKGAGDPYRPGARGWIKIKSRQTVDCVIGAVIGPANHPEAIVAGRYTSTGQLTIYGRTGPLTSVQATAVAAAITPAPAGQHPWPVEIGSGHVGAGRVTLTHVEPTVIVEVSADPATSGNRPRHILRFIRLRTDLNATDLDPAG